MSSKLHILQHVSFEGAGSIENWGRQNNFLISKTKFFDSNWSLPTIKDFNLLVVMGGPMGVNDETSFPWLKQEKELIATAMDADKKIIGVCLGAQLIASILGARVYPNRHKEIGWFDVEKTEETKHLSILRKFPDRFSAFHWHSDTFDLPVGAKRLFRSQACAEQGFLVGSNILSLQLHLEVTTQDINVFLESIKEDLASGGTFVQTADSIKAQSSKTTLLSQLLVDLMDDFMQLKKSEILETTNH